MLPPYIIRFLCTCAEGVVVVFLVLTDATLVDRVDPYALSEEVKEDVAGDTYCPLGCCTDGRLVALLITFRSGHALIYLFPESCNFEEASPTG